MTGRLSSYLFTETLQKEPGPKNGSPTSHSVNSATPPRLAAGQPTYLIPKLRLFRNTSLSPSLSDVHLPLRNLLLLRPPLAGPLAPGQKQSSPHKQQQQSLFDLLNVTAAAASNTPVFVYADPAAVYRGAAAGISCFVTETCAQ